MHIVRAATSSDGDGPPRPSDEVMDAVRDAEAYFGFGVPRLLFLEGKQLRWVHSAAAGVGTALYPEMVESRVRIHELGSHPRDPDRRVRRRRRAPFSARARLRARPAAAWRVEQGAVRPGRLRAPRDGHGARADRRRGRAGRRDGRASDRAGRDLHGRPPARRAWRAGRLFARGGTRPARRRAVRSTTSSCWRRRSPPRRKDCSPRSG